MAQIANITVFDGAATPVSHILTPISVTRAGAKVTAEWRENLASVPAYAQASCSMSMERLKSGVYRVDAKVAVPVLESVSGQNSAGYTAAPKVAYTNTFVATGYLHERSTITDRRIARQMLANLLNNVSTSVAASTSGFVPDLFDSLVAPT